MFSTKSVNSLKNLFASYHEPLPLSKQQSQKLLDGLKVSFRSQLDREYGRLSDSPSQSSKFAEAEAQIRHSPANRHLKDILSNPLFSYNKDTMTTLPTPTSLPKRDPMDVFDHAVAKGMMTLQAATGCMIAKRRQIQAADSRTEMASSQIASRIVRWLRSSGNEKDLQFLENQPFIRALAPFLVAEGMEEVAWDWLTSTVNGTAVDVENAKRLTRSSFLLGQIVRTKCQPQHGNLDEAISTMLQAQEKFRQSPLLSDLLLFSWRSVSWFSTVEGYSRTAPSEKLFDAHMATADRFTHPLTVERAHLHLYHPSHPDHTPALQFFKDKRRLQRMVNAVDLEKLKQARLKGMSMIPWIAFLGHDTVSHLTQSGRAQEAEGVTQLLESELSDFYSENLHPT